MYLRSVWSTSKFATKLRGTPLPEWGTKEEWEAWRLEAKKAHPFRFWLTESVFRRIDIAVHYPINKVIYYKYFLKSYFTDRKDILTSNGLLKRGEWYDLDTRIEVCVFESFKNFIEQEMTPFISPDEVRVPTKEYFENQDKFYGNTNHTQLYEVYLWWKEKREDIYFNDFIDNIELNDNLMKIIKLRGILWT